MIASWCLLSYLKAADTRQNASFAVRKKSQLTDDIPDDPLTMIRQINAEKAVRTHAYNYNIDADKNKERTSPPGGHKPVNRSYINRSYYNMINNSNDDIIDDNGDNDDIEAFLRQFDDIPANDDVHINRSYENKDDDRRF